MVQNNRKYPRTEIEIDVELIYGNDSVRGKTHDVSEGGMFLKLEDTSNLPLGDMVEVSFEDPLDNYKQKTRDAAIVRVADHGIAIAYVDLTAF